MGGSSPEVNISDKVIGIVVFIGKAEVAKDTLPAIQIKLWVEEYPDRMERLNLTQETFRKTYSVPMWVRPIGLRGH